MLRIIERVKNLIFFFSTIILNADENSFIIRSEIRPDMNNQGMELIDQTVRFNSPIEILNSGWVDLYGDDQYTEYFAVYSQYNGKAIGTILSSLRKNKTTYKPVCLYVSFPMTQLNLGNEIIELDLNGNDRYGFDFFQYNNMHYIIIYRRLEWDYFTFTIYKFELYELNGIIDVIYREEDNLFDRYEIIDGNIIFFNGENRNILIIEGDNIYFIGC